MSIFFLYLNAVCIFSSEDVSGSVVNESLMYLVLYNCTAIKHSTNAIRHTFHSISMDRYGLFMIWLTFNIYVYNSFLFTIAFYFERVCNSHSVLCLDVCSQYLGKKILNTIHCVVATKIDKITYFEVVHKRIQRWRITHSVFLLLDAKVV